MRLATTPHRHAPGTGAEALTGFARQQPDTRVGVILVNGEIVDGLVASTRERALLICILPADRPMRPALG